MFATTMEVSGWKAARMNGRIVNDLGENGVEEWKEEAEDFILASR